MKFFAQLLFCVLIVLTSCMGQNTSSGVESIPILAKGNPVGMLSESIWIVYQAANGDYWYGGEDGAYRFDGKTTLHFTESDGLSNKRIRGIQEDKHGNIYVSTIEGIDKFDGHTFAQLTPIISKSEGDNWKLQPDDLWFNTLGKNRNNGPYRYDGEHLYQLVFPKHHLADDYYKQFPDKSWSPYEVYYCYRDSKGTMWFGTSDFGVCRYDGNSHSWLYEEHLTITPDGGSFGIRSILEDSNGDYWFCNTRYRYNISADSIVDDEKVLINYQHEKGIEGINFSEGSDYIFFMAVVEDREGVLWMATYNQGVWSYDGETVTHYSVKQGDKDVTLFSIFKDREGQLWLGTHESGVYLFNGQAFEQFLF